jgi:hypothetical protein
MPVSSRHSDKNEHNSFHERDSIIGFIGLRMGKKHLRDSWIDVGLNVAT